VEEGLGLYVVCDGASGTPAGEVAARVASEALERFVEGFGDDLERARGEAARAIVQQAMACALRAVVEAERTEPALGGLATTVTMLLAHGSLGVFGHWGDSRAYLIRRHRAHQLTVDHELTDALSRGRAVDVEFDVFALDLEPSDTIVLCTDGAEEVLQEDAIARVAGEISPRLLASRIVSAAHRRRPEQDATAVVVRVRAEREPGWLELSLPSRGTTFGHTLERT
jgi:protein phosphatase